MAKSLKRYSRVVKNYVIMRSIIIIIIIIPLIEYTGEVHCFLALRKHSTIAMYYVVKAEIAKSLMR